MISCSERKLRSPRRPIAALDRYDGVFYRLLRKARREGNLGSDLTLVILSAKFGLLSPKTPIPYYEQRMDKTRQRLLQPSIHRKLTRVLRRKTFDRVFINLGRDYAPTIANIEELRHAVWASGGIGQRAQLMKRWLIAENRLSHSRGGHS